MLNSHGNTTLKYRIATVLVAVVAAFGVVACGGGGDAEEVVKDFAEGFADGDGGKVCGTLAGEAREQLSQGNSCEENIEAVAGALDDDDKEELRDIDPDVEEDGDKATATVKDIGGDGESEIQLEKQDGDWKIVNLGS